MTFPAEDGLGRNPNFGRHFYLEIRIISIYDSISIEATSHLGLIISKKSKRLDFFPFNSVFRIDAESCFFGVDHSGLSSLVRIIPSGLIPRICRLLGGGCGVCRLYGIFAFCFGGTPGPGNELAYASTDNPAYAYGASTH